MKHTIMTLIIQPHFNNGPGPRHSATNTPTLDEVICLEKLNRKKPEPALPISSAAHYKAVNTKYRLFVCLFVDLMISNLL